MLQPHATGKLKAKELETLSNPPNLAAESTTDEWLPSQTASSVRSQSSSLVWFPVPPTLTTVLGT